MLTKVRCPKPECGMSVDVPQDSLGRVSRCKLAALALPCRLPVTFRLRPRVRQRLSPR